MKLSISHKTSYQYEKPVELNAQTIFLKPLQRPYLSTQNYQLDILPVPNGLEERLSIEGNPYFQAWFNGPTEKLEVHTSFQVISRPFNPFSFIIDLDFLEKINSSEAKPFRYDARDTILLYPYLITDHSPTLYEIAQQLFHKNPGSPISYLMELTSTIHSGWKHIIRTEENLWEPEQTFSCKEGSCRDLSWMLIHMLRMQGLASRFVSGYAYNPELEEGHELHAWVEAYLPGAGWIGMDPSLGLFTNENYIPLACSSDAENTLPLHGKYWGAAKAHLTTFVEIHQIPEDLKEGC